MQTEDPSDPTAKPGELGTSRCRPHITKYHALHVLFRSLMPMSQHLVDLSQQQNAQGSLCSASAGLLLKMCHKIDRPNSGVILDALPIC